MYNTNSINMRGKPTVMGTERMVHLTNGKFPPTIHQRWLLLRATRSFL